MVNVYVKRLLQLIDDLFEASLSNIEIKNFFGGAGAYIENQIFMTLTKVGLALKLPEINIKYILENEGKELRYFAKGHVKKQYVLLPQKIIEDSENLKFWISKSIDYVFKIDQSKADDKSENSV